MSAKDKWKAWQYLIAYTSICINISCKAAFGVPFKKFWSLPSVEVYMWVSIGIVVSTTMGNKGNLKQLNS